MCRRLRWWSIIEKYHNTPVRNYKAVSAYAGDEHFDVEQPELTAITRNFEIMQGMKVTPNEHKIREIMMQMGKSKPGDELNCGMCGYGNLQGEGNCCVPEQSGD